MIDRSPIIALSTPPGQGAIAVIRLSGDGVIDIVDSFFFGKNLTKAESHTVHYGKIKTEKGVILDECLASVFRNPRSYTKEDLIEISCHGSPYIVQQIIQLFLRQGIRQAQPGEFTLRAFLNGQLDLSRAEAVADIIASDTQKSHQLAMNQMRGGVTDQISHLRQELIDFASLIELELDFGDEDVAFADRDRLKKLVKDIIGQISLMRDSFSYGNAVKNGVSVAIVGRPNVGKSTLLNALLGDDRAIVSEIAGTTRDVIEDQLVLEGIKYRFIDTAGLRKTEDEIELQGIARSYDALSKAALLIYMDEINEDHESIVTRYRQLPVVPQQLRIIVLNKSDVFHTCHQYDIEEAVSTMTSRTPALAISAKENMKIDELKRMILEFTQSRDLSDKTIITNARHYEALQNSLDSLKLVSDGLDNKISGDLIALDIRQALHHMGQITGEIYTDDLLDSIFSRFCIGK